MSEISISSITNGTFFILFGFYVSRIIPKPSKKIMDIFRNPLVQFLIITIVAYNQYDNLSTAILISISTLLIIRMIPRDPINEN